MNDEYKKKRLNIILYSSIKNHHNQYFSPYIP